MKMHALLIICLCFCFALLACDGNSSNKTSGPKLSPLKGELLIISDDELVAAAKRYQEFRETAGVSVSVKTTGEIVSPNDDRDAAVAAIKDAVKKQFDQRDKSKPFYLLLLGDAFGSTEPTKGVPTGEIRSPFDSQMVTSDNVYADMDGDDLRQEIDSLASL